MKKALLLTIVTASIFIASSCKKCFRCYNECVQCSIVVNNHTFSHVLCNDSFATNTAYKAAISADTSAGYTCLSTNPTYDYSFCVNQPGKDAYPIYYNKGGRATCDEK